MRDDVPPPKGRIRMHRVGSRLVKRGRAAGKSTHNIPLYYDEIIDSLAEAIRPKPVGPTEWAPAAGWVDNLVLYEWGAIVGNLLLRGGVNYGIAGMYVEFANVASPGDTVSTPALTRDPDQGVSYYNGLSSSSTQDYLRVPLIAGTMNTTDPVNFPKGNAPTFFCQTSGVAGVHGKPFGDAYNSTVIGGALVAFVDAEDYTQDLVFSRFYLDAGSQLAKLATGQIGVEWEMRLK